MNFADVELDGPTAAFRTEVIEFLDAHLGADVHEREWQNGAGHDPSFHKALGERGWVVPTWPVAEGGAGLSALDAAILERELAARHVPGITRGTTALVLAAVRTHAGDRLRDEVLAGVASGDICFCLGYTEPDAGSDLAAVRTRATREGDGWVIDGQKMFTTGAQHCRYAFLVTRTDTEAPKHRGITMFLCPLEGVEIQPIHTLGGERTNTVYFDGHRISDHYRLGEVNDGWRVLTGPLDAEHALRARAEIELESRGGKYGRANVDALEIAVAWALEAGPDGRRPIDDPIIRRRLARVAVNLEMMTVAPGPMGRILSAELFMRNASELLEVIGPRSIIPHGEDGAMSQGWLEYCHRFAQGTAIYGGTTEIHRNIIAEQMLGLPKSGRPRDARRKG